MATTNPFRQGDVLVIRVEQIPQDVVPVEGRVILAHGEMTGHAHEIKSKSAKLFDRVGERFLSVSGKKSVILEHQEHDPIEIPVGFYKVIRQADYSPEAIRSVAD